MPCTTERQSPQQRFARPTVVVSSCLLGKPVRWDGTRISCAFVRQLRPFVSVVPVCPETAIGLGVPRDPIRLISSGDSVRLIQPSSGQGLTRAMKHFSRQFIDSSDDVDGFILKARSPSCGLKSVKLFESASGSKVVGRTYGLFANEVIIRNSRGLPVIDEQTLRIERQRHHFLTRLFRMAAFRAVVRTGMTEGLIRFHNENHLLLAAYNQTALRILNRIMHTPEKKEPNALFDLYRTHLLLALKQPMRNRSITNRHRQQKNPSVAVLTLLEPFPAKLREIPTT